jgi:Spy/CpxP family protein refolding chaperone
LSTPHRPLWQHPQIISTLFLVFLAGGATGALTFRLLRERVHPHVAAAPKDLPKEPTKEAVVQRFKSELNLTPDQTTQISVVLEDFSHYYESLQEQQTDIRATGRNRIVAILTPEQREKFERMMNEIAPQLTPTSR